MKFKKFKPIYKDNFFKYIQINKDVYKFDENIIIDQNDSIKFYRLTKKNEVIEINKESFFLEKYSNTEITLDGVLLSKNKKIQLEEDIKLNGNYLQGDCTEYAIGLKTFLEEKTGQKFSYGKIIGKVEEEEFEEYGGYVEEVCHIVVTPIATDKDKKQKIYYDSEGITKFNPKSKEYFFSSKPKSIQLINGLKEKEIKKIFGGIDEYCAFEVYRYLLKNPQTVDSILKDIEKNNKPPLINNFHSFGM